MLCSAQERLATDVYAFLPLPTKAFLESDQWQGGALLDLSESKMVRQPTAAEISANFHWLMPIVRTFPDKAIMFKAVCVCVSLFTQLDFYCRG